MGPAELLDYDRTRLRGVMLAEDGGEQPCRHRGASARHSGASDRSTDIIDLVDTGDPIIVDGGLGEIFVRPSPGIEQAYAEKVRFYARQPGTICRAARSPRGDARRLSGSLSTSMPG